MIDNVVRTFVRYNDFSYCKKKNVKRTERLRDVTTFRILAGSTRRRRQSGERRVVVGGTLAARCQQQGVQEGQRLCACLRQDHEHAAYVSSVCPSPPAIHEVVSTVKDKRRVKKVGEYFGTLQTTGPRGVSIKFIVSWRFELSIYRTLSFHVRNVPVMFGCVSMSGHGVTWSGRSKLFHSLM